MRHIIVVGTGDVFRRFLAPSLEALGAQGLLRVLATVDIKPRQPLECFSGSVEHKIRASHEPLSSLLGDLKRENPIVILAHDNDLHYQDARDLVEAGFQVMLEKPYVTNREQFDALVRLIAKHPQQIFLMGYYFMRKMSPLFLLSGMIRHDSFYLTTEEVFKSKGTARGLHAYAGKLIEVVGEPVSLEVTTLEGAGSSGRLDHRGSYIFDTRRGGGMIQDMGIHALLPLFVLEQYLGRVEKPFTAGDVKTAVCRECHHFAKSTYGIPEECVAETYAEIGLRTEKGIPAAVSVGKYTADLPAQKNVVLRGTKGEIDLDMHEHFMELYQGQKLIDRIELVTSPGSKYYPVVRAGLDYFAGQSPFTVDFSQKQLEAQELTLAVLEKARQAGPFAMYGSGEQPRNIFKQTVTVAQ